MQTNAQKSFYWKLEQIAEPISNLRSNGLKGWLAEIGQSIIHRTKANWHI